MRFGSVAMLLCAMAVVPATGSAAPRYLDPQWLESIDDAQLHGTITPPGADTAHATAEIEAYDSLVQGYPALTEAELRTKYFKDRRFGPVAEEARRYSPRAGVTVVRDAKWGEPKIFGVTDGDLAFGAGYVAAEDRLPIMELLRALGRAEAFQLLGTAQAWLADGEMARLYGYTEAEWQAQLDRLPAVYGRDGQDIVMMVREYVAGVNSYIAVADQEIAPWRPTDVVAAVSTVRALFGAGGGAELSNAALLASLTAEKGPAEARAVYEDFRSRDNADGPVHTTTRFPYIPAPPEPHPAANATGFSRGGSGAARAAQQLRDLAGQARGNPDALKLPGIDLSRPAGSMSNHLIVGASRTATGIPILMGGPQAGYFSPQILMDYELHSPTIHARGAGFPGLSTLVVMGRTQDYAWTPTAGGSDMIDTYVEKLCSPDGSAAGTDSRFYEFDGRCVAMNRRTLREAESAPPAIANAVPDIIVERTVHGPVVARGMLGDAPVAVTQKRSTYMKELDAAVSILRMNRNEATDGDRFVDIFRESHNLSTNWGYANDREIAYVHGGLYPQRPDGVHPDFPVWGTGQWEWKKAPDGENEYLGRAAVPHEVAPERDFVVSWNNRPAPGWGGSDAQWGWSSVYRADLLIDQIEAAPRGTITPVRLTQMMEEAGLTDLRGHAVLPLALRLIEQAPDVGAREREMVRLLREWRAAGALRRDGDGDGAYEHSAAVAIMDAWWEPLIRTVFDPALGDSARIPLGFDNAPNSGGSAYQDGWYGYLWTALSQALGEDVKSPFSRPYCGSRADCASKVLASLRAAGDALGGDDPSAWSADAEAERIRFLPAAMLSMHWVNRPTTQQIAMFGALRKPCLTAFKRVRVRVTRKGRVRVIARRYPGAGRVRITLMRRGKRLRRLRIPRRAGRYVVRIRARAADGSLDERRVVVIRRRGRVRVAPGEPLRLRTPGSGRCQRRR